MTTGVSEASRRAPNGPRAGAFPPLGPPPPPLSAPPAVSPGAVPGRTGKTPPLPAGPPPPRPAPAALGPPGAVVRHFGGAGVRHTEDEEQSLFPRLPRAPLL